MTLSEKMATMERLLIEQRQKGQQLESELSLAQDRIGGAERRARVLEEENVKIKGELQSWQEYYEQEETSPEEPVSAPIPPSLFTSVAPSLFNFTMPMQMEYSALGSNMPLSQALSGPSLTSTVATSTPAVESTGWVGVELTPENIRDRHSSEHRVSFGSVFPGSSGNRDGNGDRWSSFGMSQAQ